MWTTSVRWDVLQKTRAAVDRMCRTQIVEFRPTMTHPELQAEQHYFDIAAEHRERRRRRALDPNAAAAGIHPAAAAALRELNLARANAMGGPDSPVAFWRITEESGEHFYIGRFPILDENYDPVVVSWKSDKGGLFNQATREQRLGVRSKRAFTTEANTIVDIADEDLLADEPSSLIVSRDAILRSLAHSRDGRLSDIVATIERAQDEVMRAESDGILIVQGGPGTGKTVIGLQRLSVIAYRQQLEKDQLLFVGPSASFLRYVGNVLPTLGDEGVRQLAISSLAPFVPQRLHPESQSSARIKGDSRMATVLKRALEDRRTRPTNPAALAIDNLTVTLDTDDLVAEFTRAVDANRPHNIGREFLREGLLRLVSGRIRSQTVSESRIRASGDFNNLLDRTWPTFSPQEYVRDLLASERRLQTHSAGVFAERDILAIARPPQARISDEPWTASDMALIDEAEVLLNGSGGVRTYEHIVVDEAQDLSPMQLRAIARRRRGGMTLLGDLAQATGPWSHRSWEPVAATLDDEGEHSYVELKVGYRVPQEVMKVAARVAHSLNLPVTLPEPIRESGFDPEFVSTAEGNVIRSAIVEVRTHLNEGRSVGLIADESSLEEIGVALRYERLQFALSDQSTASPITLAGAAASKGLEFDAVVIVEPADIADGPTGLAGLFVAMTRTTGPLSVVFSKPLPAELRDFTPASPRSEPKTVEPDSTVADPSTDAPGSEPTESPAIEHVASDHTRTVQPRKSPSKVALDALVDWVVNEIRTTLRPEAIEEFVTLLSERLRESADPPTTDPDE